jgi:hypothetical protein
MKLIRNYDLSDIERLRELGAKIKIIQYENVTIAAGATFTVVDFTGTGIWKRFDVYIDGASGLSSYDAGFKVIIDGEVLFDHWLSRFIILGKAARTGTRDGYTGVYDTAAYTYAAIRYVDYPFYNSLKIEITNRDTANAAAFWGIVEILWFKNL